jgi:hypothetical protein
MKMANRVDISKNGSMPLLQRGASGKRGGPVEAVIAWAWREELPKVPKRQSGPMQMAGGWDRAGRFAELLSPVDLYGVNQYGAVPDFSADSWPCRDAQLIGGAVMALDDYALELPDDWRPAPELDGFGGLGVKAVSEAWRRMTRQEADGRLVLRLKPSELVIRRAVMGVDVEAMAIEGVEQRFEEFPNGQEKWFVMRLVDTIVGSNADGSDRTVLQNVELNGWSSKTRRPLPDANRKPYLDPDPVDAIIARAEHEIWMSSLALVQAEVAHELEDVEMFPTAIPEHPWLHARREARVLPDLVAADAYAKAERKVMDDAFAARFPRWFKALQKQL